MKATAGPQSGRLLRARDIAERANVSLSYAKSLFTRRAFPVIRLATNVVRVREEDFEKYIRSHEIDVVSP